MQRAPWQGPPPGAQGWGHPHAGAPHGSPHATPTVARVPLLPGERVLYFHKPPQGANRLWYILGGIVTLPMLIGFYLLYVAIDYEARANHYWVITNQRIFTANARGGVLEAIGIGEISNLVHRRGSGTNSLIVHSPRKFISFRMQEKHDLSRLKPMLENLRDPRYLHQAPSVPFEA